MKAKATVEITVAGEPKVVTDEIVLENFDVARYRKLYKARPERPARRPPPRKR